MSLPVGPRYPWGQEAFDKAKKENKPIFLSGIYPPFPEWGSVTGRGLGRVLWVPGDLFLPPVPLLS